jgi:pimeloyl-ACP methyl ester carboxylesterase
MGSDGSTVGRTGTAVLVHGGWGHPADWNWVKDELRSAGVHVLTPDLPSHRSGAASFADDVETVRDAIRVSSAPVVLVGWSYGGDVIGVAAAGEDSVVHLVYVAAVPALAEVEPRDTSWADNDPHILVGEDGSFGLDNAWWLEAEGKRLFAGAVLEHLRRTPRRPVSRASASDPRTAAAWLTIPTTVLIGRHDMFISLKDRQWLDAHLDDVRSLDANHFVLFTHPATVARAVLESLTGDQPLPKG